MKRILVATLCTALTVFLVASCIKPGPIITNPDPKRYQIAEIGGSSTYWTDTATFSYNKKGDPTSIMILHASTGRSSFIFKYDQVGRLTDYIGIYRLNDPIYEIYHRIGYDPHHKFVYDTFYVFGHFGPNGPVSTQFDPVDTMSITKFTLDDKQRIVQADIRDCDQGYPPLLHKDYYYNAQGNLSSVVDSWPEFEFDEETMQGSWVTKTNEYRPGPYNDKVNMHRLHPVWQYIDRNYSVNSTDNADSYNAYGLPLSFGLSKEQGLAFLSMHFDKAVIKYRQ